MNLSALKKLDPRLWLIIALGVITVGFCLYKAIDSTQLERDTTDRPAPAFAPVAPRLISQEAFIVAPRLPFETYRALSNRSFAVAKLALEGSLDSAALRKQGMASEKASSTANFFATAASDIKGLRLEYEGPFELTSIAGGVAVFRGNISVTNTQSGSAARSAALTFAYTSSDGFLHSRLSTLTLSAS